MKFYIPYLDSLRAIAVYIVVARHYGLEFVPGGFGVTIFFFISGFLITTLLLKEESKFNSISLKSFYVRRIKRLGPPLIIFFALTIPFYVIFFDASFDTSQVLFGAFYLGNFHNILVDYQGWEYGIISYRILWSLAIEEHFYLFFPIFLILVKNEKNRALFVLLGILASLFFRYLAWFILDDSESFNYHFTLTRMDSILFGIFLAMATKYSKGYKKSINASQALIFFILGLSLILFSFIYRDEFFQDVLKFSIQGIGLFLITYTLFTENVLKSLFDKLDFKITKFLGKISYEIYLWHYPILHIIYIFFDGIIGKISALIATVFISYLFKEFVSWSLIKFSRNQSIRN